MSRLGGYNVGSDVPMGGKPSKGTSKDRRLKGNKRSGGRSGGKKLGRRIK